MNLRLLYKEVPFPLQSDYDGVLSSLIERASELKNVPAVDVICRFAGTSKTFPQVGRYLHHVGFYVGDYVTNEDFWRWHTYLRECADRGRIGPVDYGPSYISAKVHGTQGWWLSTTMAEMRVELFCCLKHGKWGDHPIDKRFRLMSHFAVGVPTSELVHEVGCELVHCEGVTLLSFTAGDSLSHTYGHYLNSATEEVLEVIYGGIPSE